jgi:hypothetical protein
LRSDELSETYEDYAKLGTETKHRSAMHYANRAMILT